MLRKRERIRVVSNHSKGIGNLESFLSLEEGVLCVGCQFLDGEKGAIGGLGQIDMLIAGRRIHEFVHRRICHI